jgi:amidase
MKDIISQSAKTLSKAIMSKEISSTELVLSCINQIESVNPKINAVVQFSPEKALLEAKEKDNLISKNKILGPLHGIPFTLKDVYNTKGDIVTAGCLGLKDNIAQEDASIVKRLKKAGAILIGKTNTPELENAADTDNLVYGKTSNPYNQKYSSGGSSGGGAAIVSACGSVFDVGADTGGSLRIPAHYCGITTVRPTMHRIPSSGLVYGLRTGVSGSFTTEGPLCRHVEDLPLLLSILQGPDGIDPKAIYSPLSPMDNVFLSKLKIAYFNQNEIIETSFETKIAIKNACDALASAGAKIVEDMPENLQDGFLIFQEMLGSNASKSLRDALTQMNVTRASSLLEKLITHLDQFACDLPTFMQRWDKWENYQSNVLKFFNGHDVLISPVTPNSALSHDSPMWNPGLISHASYAWSISATLLPVVIVRAGTSKSGLPIGIQIITKPFHEHVGLAVAQHIENSLGGWEMPNL